MILKLSLQKKSVYFTLLIAYDSYLEENFGIQQFCTLYPEILPFLADLSKMVSISAL